MHSTYTVSLTLYRLNWGAVMQHFVDGIHRMDKAKVFQALTAIEKVLLSIAESRYIHVHVYHSVACTDGCVSVIVDLKV